MKSHLVFDLCFLFCDEVRINFKFLENITGYGELLAYRSEVTAFIK